MKNVKVQIKFLIIIPEEQVSLTKHEEEFKTISGKWQVIKEEAIKVASNMSEGWLYHVKTLNEGNLIIGEGNWTVYPLIAWGKRKAFACSKAPQTCNIIKDDFPLAADFSLGVVKFEHMFGKTRTIPHCGPVNTRLRMMLPLQVTNKIVMRKEEEKYIDRVPDFQILQKAHKYSNLNFFLISSSTLICSLSLNVTI